MNTKSDQILQLITRLYQVTPFTLMRQKAPMVEQVYSCIQRNGLNVLLDNNLESTFIEISLPRKRNFLCIYKHPYISITDYFFNFSQSSFAKVKEDKGLLDGQR